MILTTYSVLGDHPGGGEPDFALSSETPKGYVGQAPFRHPLAAGDLLNASRLWSEWRCQLRLP
jgi:hypothetical protein